jgi:addiction module HigA family antidote
MAWVIKSFRCRETEKMFNRIRSRKFVNIERPAFRRLRALHQAETLADLAGSGMSAEALRGNRAGQYSIRVNDQYRICFRWASGEATEVEIVITTREICSMPRKKQIAPVHPGEMLREEYMKPAGLSVNGLALHLRVPATRIGAIIHEERAITADTALRLARYFGTSPKFWMGLQTEYDLEVAEDKMAAEIERDVRPRDAAA